MCNFRDTKLKDQNFKIVLKLGGGGGGDTDNLAQVLERRAGSDSEVCCRYTYVKEFDSWEGHENCHKYCVEICSGVHLHRMLSSGLRNMSWSVEVVEA